MTTTEAYFFLVSVAHYCGTKGAYRAAAIVWGSVDDVILSNLGEVQFDGERALASLDRWQHIRELEHWADWDRDHVDSLRFPEVTA